MFDFIGRIKLYLIAAGVFVAAVLAAYLDGRAKGSLTTKATQAAAEAKAATKAKGVSDEVQSLTPDAVKSGLDKWMRD